MICAVRGGQNRRESPPGGGGRGRVAGDGSVGTEPPRLDSAGEEGEEEAANRPVRFDPRGEDRSYGGELGKRAAMEELGWGESSRRGRAEGGNGQGGQVANAWDASSFTGTQRRRVGAPAWRQWPWWHCGEERRKIPGNPLAAFS